MNLGKNFLYKFVPVLLLAILASCTPSEKTTECDNDEAYDSSSRKCVSTLSSAGNLINFGSKSPASSYTVPSNSATAITHRVSVTNPNKLDFVTKWYRHDANGTVTRIATNKLSYSFVPVTLTPQIYVFEVILFDEDGEDALDSKSWTVVVNPPAPPTMSSPTPGASITKINTDAAFDYEAVVSNPEFTTNTEVIWTIDGVELERDTVNYVDDTTVSVEIDPADYEVGSHTIQAALTDGTDVFHTQSWNLNITAPVVVYPVVQTQTPSSSNVNAVNGVSLSAGTSFFEIDGTLVSDFCVSVDNVLGSDGASGVRVSFYIDGVLVQSGNLATDYTDHCLLADLAYDPNFGILTSQTFTDHTIQAKVFDLAGDDTEISSIASPIVWNIDARPANTAPEIIIDEDATEGNCTFPTSILANNCTITQDAATDFVIEVSADNDNPDYDGADLNQYSVDFELEGTSLDGATHDISDSDCVATTGEGIAKYTCSLIINSYDDNGPITTPVTYELTAKVSDNGSIYGGAAKESNEVKWNIATTNESETAPVLATAAAIADDGTTFVTCDGSVTDLSFVADPLVSLTTVEGVLTEGETYSLQTCISDYERDNYQRKLYLCTDGTSNCNTKSSIDTIATVARVDGNEYHLDSNTFSITEDIVTGANSATVYLMTEIVDVTDAGIGLSGKQVIEVTINNTNPAPVAALDYTLDQDTTYNVMAGFPFTIDPGTITDASVTDGETIEYQWEIDAGAGWIEIPGADKRVLNWIPDSFTGYTFESVGVGVKLRLKFGDNGFGNDVATSVDYADADGDGWDNIIIWPNIVDMLGDDGSVGQGVSEGEIAVWHDAATYTTYSAYITGSGNTITVEKTYNDASGMTTGSIQNNKEEDSITFDAVDQQAGRTARNISITGNSDEIYIAYQSDDTLAGEFLRVRRIITDSLAAPKTGFTHGGAFDFTYDDTALPVLSNVGAGAVAGVGTFAITGAASVGSDSITVQGITFTEGVDYTCVSCGNGVLSDALTTLINNSDEEALQGIIATDNTTSVDLSGVDEDNDVDSDFHPTEIGSIVVDGTNWYVPYLDGDASGASKNTLAIASGPIGVVLDSTMVSSTVAATPQATQIASTIDNSGNLVIAMKTYSGEVDLYEVDPAALTAISQFDLDVFDGNDNVGNLKVSAGLTIGVNTDIFIVGLDSSTYGDPSLIMSVYDIADYTTPLEQKIDLYGATLQQATDVNSFDVKAGLNANEAFIGVNMASSHPSFASTAYLLHVTGSSSQHFADCGDCTPINLNLNGDVTEDMDIALTNVSPGYTIGDVGDTASENEKDVIFFNFHTDDLGTTIIQSTMINIEQEETDATSNSVDGYATPYVKDD